MTCTTHIETGKESGSSIRTQISGEDDAAVLLHTLALATETKDLFEAILKKQGLGVHVSCDVDLREKK